MARDERDHCASMGVGSSMNPGTGNWSSYGLQNVDSWAVSTAEEETFAFLWVVKEYSIAMGRDEVKSPIFHGGKKSNHSWSLKIIPKKLEWNGCGMEEYLAVYLKLEGMGDRDQNDMRTTRYSFEISLLDADGRSEKRAGGRDWQEYENWAGYEEGFSKFIRSSDIISPSRRFLNDNSLKVHCRVWIKHGVQQCKGVGLQECKKVKWRKERLASDFGKLFKDNVATDVAVITNNSTFMAHKSVLAARSSVFAAMFNINMMERELSSVKIPDFEDDVVKAMLEYLYTGETELLDERAPDLLQIAEKYDLEGLKEDCEDTIADNLSVENAAQVLVMAHMYNARLLKPCVIDYINYKKEDVTKTKSFLEITQTHPNIIAELYLSL